MNNASSLLVPVARISIAAALLVWAGACVGPPDLNDSASPLVVTENSPGGGAAGAPTARSAAVEEMRAKARAADTATYPEVFQSAQVRRLAAREEPRAVSQAEAIEVELAALAQRRGAAATPGEIAAMEARAAELRRLAAEAQRPDMRR